MQQRVAVISNGIGQVQRLNILCDFQRRIEQGKSLEPTICTDCVYRRNQMLVRLAVIGNGIGQVQ
jgi:hypothetical protein